MHARTQEHHYYSGRDYIRAMVCGYSRIHRERKRLLMLQGYVDDSGSEPSSRTFILAGYVLPASVWELFSDSWDAALRSGRPIDWLHMKDTGKDEIKGQFSGWSVDEIDAKLLPLGAIINSFSPIALVCRANWSEYKKFRRGSPNAALIDNPYKAMFYEIIKIMHGVSVRANNLQSVDFVFDNHGPVGIEAIGWYDEIKDLFPLESQPFFGSTPLFKDDKDVRPLQAADMLAWFMRRKYAQPVTRQALLAISSDISQYVCADSELSAESFESAARNFARVAKLRQDKQSNEQL